DGNTGAPCRDCHPAAVRDTELLGELRMDLQQRLGILIHQWPDPPCLAPRKEHVHYASRRQDNRIFRVHLLGWWRVLGDIESSLAVGEVKRSRSSRDRIPRPRLE